MAKSEESGFGQAKADEPILPCKKDDHWVEFRYLMKGTQFPIADHETCTLVYPSGKKDNAVLSKGRVRRDGVPAGMYELQPKHLTGVAWKPSLVYSGEKVSIQVNGENIPDGEAVAIRIFRQYQPVTSQPLDTLSVSFGGGIAKANWSYEQKTGEPPYGSFIAVAQWKSKTAMSAPLTARPYSVDDDKGLQQRLKHLGYYRGAIDGIVGSDTEQAVRKMQDAHPPLVADGIAGHLTRNLLGAITY